MNQQVFALGGEVAVYASAYAQGMVSTCSQLEVGGDTIAHGSTLLRGFTNLHSFYSDGLLSLYTSLVYDIAYWGTGGITITPGGVFWNATGTTFAASLLTSGSLTLGTFTNGSAYVPGTGQWIGGIAITPASIDTYGGLNDPQTGAKFCLTSGPSSTNLVRVNFAGTGGAKASPYTAKAGDQIVVDPSGGNIVINAPTFTAGQVGSEFSVELDAAANAQVNTVTVNASGGVNIQQPPPNNGPAPLYAQFVASFTFAGTTPFYSGVSIVGFKAIWQNAGSTGGLTLA
jgi:hypothetical protein